MGVAFLHGNGGSGANLNFEVKAYSSKDDLPSTAKENSIAAITDVEITNWIFSFTEPSDTSALWFKIGTESAVSFNLLKKNAIYIYPISCYLYNGERWYTIEAWIYKGSGWVQFSELITSVYLYQDGDVYEDVTGGYSAAAIKHLSSDTTTATAPSISYGETSMTMSTPTVYNNTAGIVQTKNKIDLTNFEKLVFEGTVTESGYASTHLSIWTQIGSYHDQYRVKALELKSTTPVAEIDISDLDGEHYIGFGFARNGSGQDVVEMTSLRLE